MSGIALDKKQDTPISPKEVSTDAKPNAVSKKDVCRFPEQPFQQNLDTPKENPKLDMEMATLTLPPLEDKDYRVNKMGKGFIQSLTMKQHGHQEVRLLGGKPLESLQPISVLISDSLSLVRKNYSNVKILRCDLIDPGYLLLNGKDEKGAEVRIVASPRFVLKAVENRQFLESRYKPKIEAAKEEIEHLKEETKSFDNLETLSKKQERLLNEEKIVLEEFKKHRLENPNKGLGGLGKEKITRYEAICLEIIDVENKIKLLRHLKDAEDDKLFYVNTLENQVTYEGHTDAGAKVKASSHRNEILPLDIFNAQDEQIARESSGTSLRNGRNILQVSSFGETPVETTYDLDGKVVGKMMSLKGVLDHYDNGKMVSSDLLYSHHFIKNIKSFGDHPYLESLLKQAAESNPEILLEEVKHLEGFMNLGNAQELAIAKMSLVSINTRIEDITLYLSGEKAAGRDTLIAYEDRDLESVLSLLTFRRRMLSDAKEITRTDIYKIEGAPGELQTAKLWDDPKSRGYFEIEDKFIDWSKVDLDRENPNVSMKEYKLLVARYLYDSKKEVNSANVLEALDAIRSLREKYGPVKIFENRNVILAAHSESSAGSELVSSSQSARAQTESYRFGKPALRESISERHGTKGSFNFLRADLDGSPTVEMVHKELSKHGIDKDIVKAVLKELTSIYPKASTINMLHISEVLRSNDMDKGIVGEVLEGLRGSIDARISKLEQNKEDIKHSLENTPPPMTFIFDGHGSEEGIYLSDGLLDGTGRPNESSQCIKFSPDEISELMKVRSEKFSSQLRSQADILVFASCYSANFIRKIDGSLEGFNKPICVGISEYGQVGFSNVDNIYGMGFYSDVMGLGNDKQSPGPTLKYLMDNQYKDDIDIDNKIYPNRTNPSMFVPDENGVLRQISAISAETEDALV